MTNALYLSLENHAERLETMNGLRENPLPSAQCLFDLAWVYLWLVSQVLQGIAFIRSSAFLPWGQWPVTAAQYRPPLSRT